MSDLYDLATDALVGQGMRNADASEISKEFVIAEYVGTTTHGVGKLPSLNIGDLTADPSIKLKGCVLNVNGNGGSGFLILRAVAERLSSTAREFGICAASIRNFSRYSSLFPYTEIVARNGLIGVLMNSAGPAAVAPFGSKDPITGTNPICFSFPTSQGGVQTLDFSTAEVVWGEIRQATLENRHVAANAFIDIDGKDATTPSAVTAVKAFGGPKGSALNLAIEVLAGLLPAGRGGLSVEDEFDCGATFLALDPESFDAGPFFPDRVSDLLGEVRNSRPLRTGGEVRAPGDHQRTRIKIDEIPREEKVDVPDTVVALLGRMAKGEKFAELSENPLYN
ncbi:Ldh family oxidoreductase [Luedemannella flava]|uniref:Ldh family oxidoreductase n=1 Tax=Luedemannella flava TaxID=349316 RepID=UPI0031D7C64C